MSCNVELEAGTLRREDIDAYWRDGFLYPIDLFSSSETASLRAEIEEIEANWLDNGLPLPLNQYKRVNAHCVMPMAARIAMDARLLDIVEGILGPDILIWSAEFFIKEPRTKHVVSMHQDLTYWGLGETSDQLTAWIALSPATEQSGCMEFVKGSHKNPIMPHRDTFSETNLLSRGQEIQVEVAQSDKTNINLMPGQMSLHHGLTIHGSGPNVSRDRRIGIAVRFLNPNARQQVAERDYAMLARGVDRSGNFINYAPPSHLFSEGSLSLYTQILQDQAQALAAGAKENLDLYKPVEQIKGT